ncbi:hypothetical protein ACIP93_37460 [Streptomyces sp. NPDC088745]|uniref:hypothetical protein n=1 Tax=Streptomyces sp. NPDC088745 TaxID=3365884 RepID=UPI0037FF9C1B
MTPGVPADADSTALRYLAAVHAEDWRTACNLSSAARAADCRIWHLTPTPTPEPAPTTASSGPPLLVYADGTTVRATPTPPRPASTERPRVGPVRVDRLAVPVHGTSRHPAGWGVLLAHTVQWPGRPARTVRTALRLVDEGGRWRVDQRAPVSDAVLAVPDPAAAALAGGPR